MDNTDDFILLTGTANPQLAKGIAKLLETPLYYPISSFADGEIRVKIEPNIRRRHVFIIQPTSAPVNDHLMELILMIDAAKRASASEIIVVLPYFGYARQDRKEMARVPISAAVIADMIEHAGANRILTIDIHAEQEEGFVRVPWDNLYGSYSLIPEIKKRRLKNMIVASPDKNGMARAVGYARRLGAEGIAVCYKERDIDINNQSEVLDMIGHVRDCDVLMVDDMIDTAGTIVHAAGFLKEKGAKKVMVAATHGLFSGEAIKKIDSSAIDEVLVTDTINLSETQRLHRKISVVSVAPLLCEAIRRIETGESISKDLILK